PPYDPCSVSRQRHLQWLHAFPTRRSSDLIEDQKKKFAKEMPYYNEAPIEPISINDLIQQQQDILARNAENQQKRQQLSVIQNKQDRKSTRLNSSHVSMSYAVFCLKKQT